MACTPEERDLEKDFENGKWPFGGEGEPDTVPTPSGPKCVEISELLARTDGQAGEYSFGGPGDMLPVAPGLYVDEVGHIPVPLSDEVAEKLIAKCEKSPFGHNFDTKMGDDVRKSWQSHPDKVHLKNPLWDDGLLQLSRSVSERLGYKDSWLKCVLYKLLVYGEGGHFLKHQDTEKEDGMIATLVIQLPSLHEGGDLVIYRGGEERHRHDFGKADGTAAYLPHYAVHYADAEHSLDKVTKGYRLALVYSLCLPPKEVHLKRANNKPLSDDLADAITNMGEEDKSFALLLSHEYTEDSVEFLGARSLKGVDRMRFGALHEANTMVPASKKLHFFIAELMHKVLYTKSVEKLGWQEYERKQSVAWSKTSGGDSLGYVKKTTTAFNFLNPGQETLSQLWMPHGTKKDKGYTGNEGPTATTKYSRFAIVAWPVAQHFVNTWTFLPIEYAVETLRDREPIDAAKLRTVLEFISARRKTEKKHSYPPSWVSSGFCKNFCELLVEAGDVALVKLFFTTIFKALDGLENNGILVPPLVKIIRTYDWDTVGPSFLSSLSNRASQRWNVELGYSEVQLALQIVDSLDKGDAQEALLKMALEDAAVLRNDAEFCSATVVELLWKWAVQYSDKNIFGALAKRLERTSPSLLAPIIEELSKYVSEGDTTGEVFKLVQTIVNKRIKWLEDRIEELDKPFTWELPDATFYGNDCVQKFLQGPEESMTTVNFKVVADAKAFGYAPDEKKGFFKKEIVGVGKDAYVIVTKTRKWFEDRQEELEQCKTELSRLTKTFGAEDDGGDKKRARHE